MTFQRGRREKNWDAVMRKQEDIYPAFRLRVQGGKKLQIKRALWGDRIPRSICISVRAKSVTEFTKKRLRILGVLLVTELELQKAQWEGLGIRER